MQKLNYMAYFKTKSLQDLLDEIVYSLNTYFLFIVRLKS